MKINLPGIILVLLCATTCTFAQIPNGYYDSAAGLTGYTLKTQLKKIIDDVDDADITSDEYFHTDQGYDSFDGFTITTDLDVYYENDNTLLDIYSENPDGTDPYNFSPSDPNDACGNYSGEGDCWNKEHVIPQSVFGQELPMRGDAHHLLPTDGRVNGFRSNYPFGVVNDNSLISQSGITNPTQNGSKLGANLNSGYSAGYTGTVFEPIDEFKGDIARIYFYFITRYEDQISAWSGYPMFNGTSAQVLDDTFLNILLEWNTMDPVSQKEIDRNDAIFNYQGNRNPFIDHPEYIDEIWSTPTSDDTQAPTTPVNITISYASDLVVNVSWDAASDNVGVTAYEVYINGTYTASTPSTTYSTGTLAPETEYCFTIKAIDAAGNASPESTSVCTTTPAVSNVVSELLFSEYIEGSGNNKALEIANYTGISVDLSNYSLKLSANGNSDWTATYPFPANASIANYDVYVIANSGLATGCISEADDINNTITGFNGNDAIGLFKNDVLIDMIGELGNGDNFAQNITLVRNETILMPSTTFNIADWNTFNQDDCSDLGSHTIVFLGTEPFETENGITVYPNPVTDGQLFIHLQDNIQVNTISLYTVTGQLVFSTGSVKDRKIDLSMVKPGLYMLQIQTKTGSFNQKLVIQ